MLLGGNIHQRFDEPVALVFSLQGSSILNV
jgi:hypothetical protein